MADNQTTDALSAADAGKSKRIRALLDADGGVLRSEMPTSLVIAATLAGAGSALSLGANKYIAAALEAPFTGSFGQSLDRLQQNDAALQAAAPDAYMLGQGFGIFASVPAGTVVAPAVGAALKVTAKFAMKIPGVVPAMNYVGGNALNLGRVVLQSAPGQAVAQTVKGAASVAATAFAGVTEGVGVKAAAGVTSAAAANETPSATIGATAAAPEKVAAGEAAPVVGGGTNVAPFTGRRTYARFDPQDRQLAAAHPPADGDIFPARIGEGGGDPLEASTSVKGDYERAAWEKRQRFEAAGNGNGEAEIVEREKERREAEDIYKTWKNVEELRTDKLKAALADPKEKVPESMGMVKAWLHDLKPKNGVPMFTRFRPWYYNDEAAWFGYKETGSMPEILKKRAAGLEAEMKWFEKKFTELNAQFKAAGTPDSEIAEKVAEKLADLKVDVSRGKTEGWAAKDKEWLSEGYNNLRGKAIDPEGRDAYDRFTLRLRKHAGDAKLDDKRMVGKDGPVFFAQNWDLYIDKKTVDQWQMFMNSGTDILPGTPLFDNRIKRLTAIRATTIDVKTEIQNGKTVYLRAFDHTPVLPMSAEEMANPLNTKLYTEAMRSIQEKYETPAARTSTPMKLPLGVGTLIDKARVEMDYFVPFKYTLPLRLAKAAAPVALLATSPGVVKSGMHAIGYVGEGVTYGGFSLGWPDMYVKFWAYSNAPLDRAQKNDVEDVYPKAAQAEITAIKERMQLLQEQQKIAIETFQSAPSPNLKPLQDRIKEINERQDLRDAGNLPKSGPAYWWINPFGGWVVRHEITDAQLEELKSSSPTSNAPATGRDAVAPKPSQISPASPVAEAGEKPKNRLDQLKIDTAKALPQLDEKAINALVKKKCDAQPTLCQ